MRLSTQNIFQLCRKCSSLELNAFAGLALVGLRADDLDVRISYEQHITERVQIETIGLKPMHQNYEMFYLGVNGRPPLPDLLKDDRLQFPRRDKHGANHFKSLWRVGFNAHLSSKGLGFLQVFRANPALDGVGLIPEDEPAPLLVQPGLVPLLLVSHDR